jgi:hypothetical protein
MKCFYHNSIDAVAICKNCSRGLCTECVSEVENGVVCKNRCEPAIEEINAMLKKNREMMAKSGAIVDRSKSLVASNRQVYVGLAIFLGCTGIMFLVVTPFLIDKVRYITLPAGILFSVFAILIFFFSKKINL